MTRRSGIDALLVQACCDEHIKQLLSVEPPDGRKRTTFKPTPKMASYLVVLVAGELEEISAEQDGA